MNAVARVLVIEDDDDLRDTVVRYLQGVGMFACGLESAEQLDAALARQTFDVAVCDVNLPGEDGFSVLARLRARGAMRFVMLTARGMLDDRLHGLGLGADYYLVKPVDLRELEMVLHNLLQRSQDAPAAVVHASGPAPAGKSAAAAPWRFDPVTWLLLSPAGERVQLSSAEARLLQCLVEQSREVVSRALLLAAMGRPGLEAYERNLDVTVSRMRRKVEQATGERLPIAAVRGEGYSFQGQASIER